MEPFFTERQDGTTTIVVFQTESLMNHLELERIGQGLSALVDEGRRHQLLLDFTKVRYLSSQAIGVLLSLHKKIAQVRGSLVLCGVGPELMDLLRITRLNRMFTIR